MKKHAAAPVTVRLRAVQDLPPADLRAYLAGLSDRELNEYHAYLSARIAADLQSLTDLLSTIKVPTWLRKH